MKTGQKIVITDLDDTLINTKLLKELRFNKLRQLGFTDSEIFTSYDSIGDGYSTEKHFKILKELRPSITLGISEYDAVINSDVLFFDTISFSKELLDDQNTKSILLTKGDDTFQRKKISLLGLSNLFDEIWTTIEPKEKFLKEKLNTTDSFIFINNKKSENDKVAAEFPNCVCYLVERYDQTLGNGAYPSLDAIKKDAGF